MKAKAATIDEYLAGVGDDQRAALSKLRKVIHSIVPGLEECISYSLPAFRLNGKVVAGFGANKRSLSYYPFSSTTLRVLAHEIESYDTTKGALHFHVDEPLPTTLVRKLVKARIAEERAK